MLVADPVPTKHTASYNPNVIDAIVIFLHVLAATIFIGPQVFLVAVAMPALRSLGDAQARQQASRAITRGFGALAGVALVVLLATGIWNYYDAEDAGYLDLDRYSAVMIVKLTLVTVIIVLTALHGAVFGRRLQRLQAEGAAEAEIAQARAYSMFASIATLAVSIGILVCAALLDQTGRSFRPRRRRLLRLCTGLQLRESP